jgi:hypothetical protein
MSTRDRTSALSGLHIIIVFNDTQREEEISAALQQQE